MPIYSYRCTSCGHAKDVLQKISDPLLTTCPACGAEAFSKQVTAAGFQLKGSGWYVTDFKGGNAPAAPKAEAAAAEGAAAPAPSGDAKPADAAPAAAPAASSSVAAPAASSAAAAPATKPASTPSGSGQ